MHQLGLIVADHQDKPLFQRLMQLYQYDSSEFNGEEPDAHGVFAYDYLDHYWTEHGRDVERRVPLLIRVDGQPAGFVLLNGFPYLEETEVDRSFAELFIMRKWRRRGIARQVVLEVLRRYPGRWQVGQERANLPAQAFWRAVLGEFTGGGYEEVDSQAPAWDGPVQIFCA